ncbi:MAG: hypothetical protein WCG97_01910 [bacterium]
MDNYQPVTIISGQPIQPLITSITPPPTRKIWRNLFLILITLVIIALAVFAYIYRYDVFESSWRHSINKIEAKYNVDGGVIEKQFVTVDGVESLFPTMSTSTPSDVYLKKVNDTIELQNSIKADVDNAMQYTGPTAGKLSKEDSSIQALYRTCYEGRSKGVELTATALDNTLKYTKAYTLIQNYYNNDLPKFRTSGAELVKNMKSGKVALLAESIKAARADTAIARDVMNDIYELLGLESFKEVSVGYQIFIDGLDDINKGVITNNASLIYKGGSEFQDGTVIFQRNTASTKDDVRNWMDTNVTAKYKEKNDEMAKVNEVCNAAEAASMPTKENTPVNMFMQKLRGL